MKIFLKVIFFILFPVVLCASENFLPEYMWYRDISNEEKDYYVAFRGQWDLTSETDCEIKILGATWFVGWIDGKYFCEGPARFSAAFPEYQTYRVRLPAGHHVLAIQVHQVGEVTRILDNPDPFLFCRIEGAGKDINVNWKCTRLDGYKSQTRRINPELGFIEWCDTRQLPEGWQKIDFNCSEWLAPVVVTRKLGRLNPLSTDNTTSTTHLVNPVASGQFIDRFGYEMDDPPARFFLRSLETGKTPPQGVWRRYDLGRIQLMRPIFLLDLPKDAVVEFGYSEELIDNRVTPYITLSAGASCNMDHYVARGGIQEFFPVTPKGGRFLEVHIYAPPEKVKFIKEEIMERHYYGVPEGSFKTEDTLLNKIWSVGVETLRACSEDVIIDNPTRERGQWTNDIVSVGLNVASVSYSDLRLLRRCLTQAAECARVDGLIAGLTPGGGIYLSSSAAQWITACIQYWEMTGDIKLLNELFSYAQKNIEAFNKEKTSEGLNDNLGWGFIDWGYVRNPGLSDMALNLHYLAALKDMVRWCNAIGKTNLTSYYQTLAKDIYSVIEKYYSNEFQKGGETWKRIGYHRAVLGLQAGFFVGSDQTACIEYIKEHILSSFPNAADAPRLSDPAANNSQLITPYFGHYAMAVLIEQGEINFVLDQYRKCWGWMLEKSNTWLEVFDTRWSHCHQWAGCPTWQMSRYLLGLQPRFDLGDLHFAITLKPGILKQAQGSLPIPGGEVIKINWIRKSDGLHYHLETPVPVDLHLDGNLINQTSGIIHIEKEYDVIFRDL